MATLIIGQDGPSNQTLVERISVPWRLRYTHHGDFGAMQSTSQYVKIFGAYKSCMLVITATALRNAHLDYVKRLAVDIPHVHIVVVAAGVTNCLAGDCDCVAQVYVSKHVLLSFCTMLRIQSCLFPEWPVRKFIDALERLGDGEFIQRNQEASSEVAPVASRFTLHRQHTDFATQHGYTCVLDHVAPFFELYGGKMRVQLPPTVNGLSDMRTIMVKRGVTYLLGEYHYDAIKVHMADKVFTVESDMDVYEWFVRQRVGLDKILFLELI